MFRAWVLASRPKTLAAAAVPVLVGCALAYSDGCFRWPEHCCASLFAFLMQIDANLINDLFDYLKGSDRGDRLGPRRACAEGWIAPRAMKRGILCTTLAACVAGLGLLRYGGPELIAVGAVCVLFAFLYTAGPYPLAYHGWGDLLVVLFERDGERRAVVHRDALRLVADERNVEDHAGRRDVGLECERSVDAGGRALRGARNHDRGADDGHAVLIDDPAGDLAGLLRLRAPAGREDDALVVDRIADVGVAEQFVECGADALFATERVTFRSSGISLVL